MGAMLGWPEVPVSGSVDEPEPQAASASAPSSSGPARILRDFKVSSKGDGHRRAADLTTTLYERGARPAVPRPALRPLCLVMATAALPAALVGSGTRAAPPAPPRCSGRRTCGRVDRSRRGSGTTSTHRLCSASLRVTNRWQRVRKRQPLGGSAGLGRSPVSRIRRRPRSLSGVGDRDRRQQGLGVRMGRVVVDVVHLPDLDDLAQVHHRHPVGDVPDHRQVVGDEQVGQRQLGLELVQQVDDAGLDRDVQRRDRLVQHDQLRLQREGAGDADALALTAGELLRGSGWRARAPDPTRPEQLADPALDLGLAGRRRPPSAPRSGRRPASAGRARPSGPGTPPAGRGACGDARAGSAGRCPGPGPRPGPRWAPGGSAPPAASSSCRSRTRRPGRGSRPP